MIAYPWGALVTGLMLIAAGCFTMARHFLLEPDCSRYPKAPVFVRHAMFGFATVLLFLGLQFSWAFFSHAPDSVPPQPTAAMQFLATALVIHKAAMLLNIIRQRYPREVWLKLNRIHDSLPCQNNRFLAWLAR